MNPLNTYKWRFALSKYSKKICSYCGYRFEDDDTFYEVTVNGKTEYIHDCCLVEMDGKEALEFFGITFEEVEI